MVFGLCCSTIGIDPLKTVSRFTFGFTQLIEGIDETTLIVGAFAVCEVITQALVSNEEYKKMGEASNRLKYRRSDFFPSMQELKEIGPWVYLKATIIGFFIGVLPGAGARLVHGDAREGRRVADRGGAARGGGHVRRGHAAGWLHDSPRLVMPDTQVNMHCRLVWAVHPC